MGLLLAALAGSVSAATYGPGTINTGITVGASADTVLAGTTITPPLGTHPITLAAGAGMVTVGATSSPVTLNATNATPIANTGAGYTGSMSIVNTILNSNNDASVNTSIETNVVAWFGTGDLSIDDVTLTNTSANASGGIPMGHGVALGGVVIAKINASSISANNGSGIYVQYNSGLTTLTGTTVSTNPSTNRPSVSLIGSGLVLGDDSNGNHSAVINTGIATAQLALIGTTWNTGRPRSVITSSDTTFSTLSSVKSNTGAVYNSGVYGSVAVFADTALISVSGGTVTTSGDNAAAVESTDNSAGALGYVGKVDLSNAAVVTTHGATAPGVLVNIGSSASVTNSSVTTTGSSSDGVHVTNDDQDNPTLTPASASVTLDGATIITQGSLSNGLYAGKGGSIVAKNLLNVTSAASAITLQLDASSLDASAVTTGTVKAATYAVHLTGGSVGQNAKFANTTFSNSAGALFNVDSSGSTATPSVMALTNSTATAAAGANVLNVTTSSLLNFTATGSTLSGNITADASSTANMMLTGNSTLTGAVDVVNPAITAGTVTIDVGSVWNMTANSVVSTLHNAGSINFIDNTLPPAFTLTVNEALTGTSPGRISLHTVLATDGAASDLIVLSAVAAATSGAQPTLLTIVNAGGAGAFTTGSGILVVTGINGAINAPTATATSFALSGPVTVTTNGVTYNYVLVPVGQNWYLQSTIAAQVITFPAQPNQTFVPGGTFPLNPPASASSGLPVTYTSTTPAVCSISGTTVTIVSVGTCTIAANQAGNANYTPAPQVTQNIVIGPAAQTISFGPQPGQTFVSGATFPLNPPATASSGLPVTYTSTTPAVCSISGTTVTMLSSGVCLITASQAGNANTAAATPVTQAININGPVVPVPTLSSNMLLALITLIALMGLLTVGFSRRTGTED